MELTYHIKWALLNPKAVVPTKDADNGGYDIYVLLEKDLIIYPGEVVIIPTGIAYEITKGWHLIAKERGSTAKINLKTSAGLNDNSYRGEVNAFLYNGNIDECIILSVDEEATRDRLGDKAELCIIYPIKKAVQQLMPVYSPNGTTCVVRYEELSTTERGSGMTGSSGK